MNFEEFKKCVENIENNIDNFINETEENKLKIKNYQKISKEVIDTLTQQYKELEKHKKEVEYYKKHFTENKRYLDIEELSSQIETLLNQYDEKLKDKLLKDENIINSIRKELGEIK